MKVQVHSQNGIVVVRPSGKLDALTAPQFQDTMNDVLEDPSRRVVIDLSDVPYISSAGLRVFILSAKRLMASGKLAVGGLTSSVRQMFELAGFEHIMAVCDDVESAIRSI